MNDSTNLPGPETDIRGDYATLFVSLELSRSTWIATSLAPGSKKMSKHTLASGNGRELLDLLARLKARAEQRIAAPVKVVAIHEVGLDGFWIHRSAIHGCECLRGTSVLSVVPRLRQPPCLAIIG